ncbi:hypothetical protein B4U80_01414 [Leptotrombidium deliense]|uniref:Phospholipid/glycerol acyltransferase domain-containing protein n=1 Tax=Leptotrombidium deliense TaxID=299467 RepID=A0A443SL77_9ACAR|nr:hypothetical protein B4U80_01414 [Leptotrombidium deliense]
MDKLSVNPYVCLNRFTVIDYIKFILGTPLVVIRTNTTNDNNKNIKAPIIILLPHTSIFDLLAVAYFREVTCVARDQRVLETDFMRMQTAIARLGNPILVKREEAASRQKVIEKIKERAKTEQVLILPEGTCSNTKVVLQFKSGAFKPGLAVQPYIIEYNCDDCCLKGIDHTSWVREGTPLLLSMWITACKLWTSMSITKLPVYVPNESEKEDVVLYASNVQKFISTLTGLRFAHYSYDDNKFLGFW